MVGRNRAACGRPSISAELETLLLRLAKENTGWGYGKLQGEVIKPGYAMSRSTVRDVLKRKCVPVLATVVIRFYFCVGYSWSPVENELHWVLGVAF